MIVDSTRPRVVNEVAVVHRARVFKITVILNGAVVYQGALSMQVNDVCKCACIIQAIVVVELTFIASYASKIEMSVIVYFASADIV